MKKTQIQVCEIQKDIKNNFRIVTIQKPISKVWKTICKAMVNEFDIDIDKLRKQRKKKMRKKRWK